MTTKTAKANEMTALEIEKLHVEIVKMMDESSKLRAEVTKITTEARWYPVVVAAGLMTAGGAAIELAIKLFPHP